MSEISLGSDAEKAGAIHIEEKDAASHQHVGTDQAGFDVTLTAHEQQKTLRAIDIRVAVVLGVMFCVSLMDRTNLGAAAIAGSV